MAKAPQSVGVVVSLAKCFIVHGWAYEVSKWEPFIQELNKFGVETVFLSVPGLTAPLEEPWAIDDYASWLESEIKSSAPAIVLGHSNGGRIALNLAAKKPALFKQMILIDSAGVPRRDKAHELKRKVFKTVSTAGKVVTNNAKARKLLYKLARQSDYAMAPKHMQAVMSNMLESDYNFDPSNVNVPTQIIWGENDATTPMSIAKELNAGIKGSKLHVIKGARHSPQFTHTNETAKLIRKLIK